MFRSLLVVCAFAATAFAEGPRQEPIQPLRAVEGLDPKKVALGEVLYHDTRLSKDNSISCASCHDLARGGDDDLPRSPGVGGTLGGVNSPTTYNSGLNFVQFWDGRAATLEEQAAGPVANPIEMASSLEEVVGKLSKDEAIKSKFLASYPDGITPKNITDAIATFERTLVTTNSRFDKYLLGDDHAITKEEKEGYELFKGVGCTACHSGPNVGGQMYQKFGLVKDYFKARGNPTDADNGRFNVTKNESDRHLFRVAPLRNVAVTAPYFHDASAKTLDEAVFIMGRYQLGRDLTPEETKKIVAFLKTLTGEYKGKPVG